jgi:tetratricopeptide (TPR) repeat protein
MLSRSVELLNRDDILEAEALLGTAIAAHPATPQALMLMGVVRIAQSRNEEAEGLLLQSLALSPGQPQVLLYLGNARRGGGNMEGAVAAYRSSVQSQPDFRLAWLALASTLCDTNVPREAEKIYRMLLQTQNSDAPALAGLGTALNALDRPDEAEQVLCSALKPEIEQGLRADIEYNLGHVALKQRRFHKALAHLEQAIALAPESLKVDRWRAVALEHLQKPDRAIEVYRRVLARDPLDLETHTMLNEQLHRVGRDSELLKSYDEASIVRPESPILLTAKGDQMVLMDRAADAEVCYGRAIKLSPSDVDAHIGLGRARSALGNHSGAAAAFSLGMKINPDHAGLLTAFSFSMLAQSDNRKALSLAERAVVVERFSQPALAVLSLCYRAMEDERGEILSGFEEFVQVVDLSPPVGYSSMQAFNAALAQHLGDLHQGAREFLSQTLRGGTRASEEIFRYRHELRDKLRASVVAGAQRYISKLRNVPSHPFLGRRSNGFEFSGSWSSRMFRGGYHVNHIHSGWISSVYYVEVPKVTEESSDHQGWLKFGEPSTHIPLPQAIGRMVQPKAGRLVLFPSYLWHGTVPFQGPEARTTVAFDLLPQ